LAIVATREITPPALIEALRAEADDAGCVSWATFSRLALYHETEGYYRRPQKRVGKSAEADFHTSVSVGPIFGQLVAAAARQLIEPANAADFTLAEIGAEPEGGMFVGVETGFGSVKSFPLGTDFEPDPHTVLVANEILDAQPFHRLEFHDGQWREWGVNVSGERLCETPLDELTTPVQEQLANALPSPMPKGYRLDLALAAESLIERWAEGNWTGAMILVDYGKCWEELTQVTPQGTARAYHRHQQSNDLLARPGQQDLTTHVCWDRIEAALARNGFEDAHLERQEAFLVKRAWSEIERLSLAPEQRGALQSLLHPGGFGMKFQALTACRVKAWSS